MDAINLSAWLTFVVVTTFTPGPNNISSSSMGILYGYRRSLPFLLGIVTGFFGIMLLSAFVSRTLLAIFPALETVMRVIGAGYILWLAYKTVRSSYKFSEEESVALGYSNGLLLQGLNPKLWVYGLTMYASFLAPITDNVVLLIVSALFLTCVAFTSISIWTIAGATIKRFLDNQQVQRMINIALAVLLAYAAIDLSGILKLFA